MDQKDLASFLETLSIQLLPAQNKTIQGNIVDNKQRAVPYIHVFTTGHEGTISD